MVKAADAFPERRDLKSWVPDNDLVGMSVENLGEQKLAAAGVVNDFLLAVPRCSGTVLLAFLSDPVKIPLGIGGVVQPKSCSTL
jgi:hypothetical protein